MLTSREVILAKIETTYNTDPTPTNTADAIQVEDPSWAFEGARMVDRPYTKPNLSMGKQVFGGTLKSVSFSAELRGPGSAYSSSVRPEIDVLLRACAMSVAVVTTPGSETATYKPVSTAHESITIYYYQDGKLNKLTGCRGQVDFTMQTGARGMAKFKFIGHESGETDTSLVTPTFDSTLAPTVKGGTFAVGGYSAIISALNFALGNKVVTPPNLSASDGYGEIRIIGRDVAGSIDPESVLVAAYDPTTLWKAGTQGAISSGTIGSTQYNRYSVSLPVTYYRSVGLGNRDGIRSFDLPFGALESSGDDEVSLVFA